MIEILESGCVILIASAINTEFCKMEPLGKRPLDRDRNGGYY
jgi:hypothetical protein